jgi:hypothetical protein
MRFRKLRIAFSVACGIACVLLIALWVRSYHHFDVVRSKLIWYEAISVCGQLKLTRIEGYFPASPHFDSFAMGEREADVIENHVREFSTSNGFGFYDRHSILLPHSFVAFITLPLAAILWIRRFSVRTLLMVTTLVAVVLGLIVWLK